MDRRAFLKRAVVGSITVGLAKRAAATSYVPRSTEPSLFDTINRVKNPAQKSPLEKSHAPVFIAPASVRAGEPFTLEVSVGETVHVMTQAHWIESIEVTVGNEPVGRVEFQPKGYLRPKTAFSVIVPKEAAREGRVTVTARERCNVHGLWEETLELKVL